MNTKAIRQLADVTLDKYRSSIPRKAFEEFVKDIIAGENRATAFRYEATPICRASFPSTLDEDDARCTVEVTVYRLNAVAVTAFLLDGPETLLRHIGLDERDTYTTKHEIDDLVTVVHIIRKERAPGKTFPLAEWGITEAECLAGCYAAGYDWEGLYEKLDRVSCACCAAKNLKELRNIYNDMPEVWADLQARQSKTSRPFKGPGKSVGDLAIRFELEKEYIAAGLSVTSRDFYTCLADRLKQRGGGTA